MARCLITHKYNSNASMSYAWGQAVAQLLEALNRKVAGSIPVGVIGIFH